MLKGTTKTGFKYEISDAATNNYELVEILAEIDENPLLMPKLLKALFGEEQTKRLKDHLRTESGTVPIDAIAEEIGDIFASEQKTKNS